MRSHGHDPVRARSGVRWRPKAALALVVAAVVGAATLSACGSSAGASSTVKIGVQGNIYDLPIQVAEAQGYFKDEGISVKLVTITASTGTSALQSGSVSLLHASPSTLAAAVGQKIPQQAIGVDAVGNPLGIVVSSDFAKEHGLSASSSGAEVAKALRGSKAGVSSTNTQAEASVFLKAQGLDPSSDVKWATLPSSSADQAALKNGQIDWFITSEPLPYQVQADGDGVVVAGPKNVSQWAVPSYSEVVMATKSYLQENGATATKFMKAIQKATAYINSHEGSSDLEKIVADAYPNFSSDAMKASIAEVDWPTSAEMDDKGWKTTLDFLDSLGTMPDGATISNDDWTNSYLG
ncbi:ABC transporter substrate-binding protein [Nocardioides cheoyonin]|uniref:ABC transporter substrate-binding protein n=1 Tax=Nocardioides cheoyonin TaxID=3156615 RepID=UPI0032B4AFE2